MHRMTDVKNLFFNMKNKSELIMELKEVRISLVSFYQGSKYSGKCGIFLYNIYIVMSINPGG